ncbi:MULTISPECIES: tripartite tricarboxylate transporter TctB family protein [unclassified Aminobacter]|uniref:tripartite tricarboxylate transporter TctB family protein n=1 Tax=unclassified Aminobacter TaxID=2644704 RepID=UPI00046570CC|nr:MULTISPECIES: tripartite tricarboxylate transporter TctB family protein [unclassified Aminobacter]TWG67665.1 tripartite tricarboxylate transporter TctB family protein [Aminobacter sp. J44]TWH28250.1 tripartite tricarboxylate transporter TctB family protein [Aminobacter sp. J15]
MNSEDAPRGVNTSDLVSGVVMLAICGGFAVTAYRYGIGTPARMGPGFFPFLFGLVGCGLAVTILIRSFLVPGGLYDLLHSRSLIFVVGSVVAFGLLIETVGLGPAVFATTVISSFADKEATLRSSVTLAAILTASIWVIFIYLLSLPMPLLERVF